ncbi:MAG: hypothetical protein JWM53_755 [bacterium]|nr:hypothetical protein [bacterium]
MLLVDFVLLLGVGAMIVGAAGFIGLRVDRRRKARDAERETERLGRENAERLKREIERRCVECDRVVDPAADVFDHDAWWCKECWLKVVH